MGKYGTLLICSNEIDVTRAGEGGGGSEKSVPLVNEVEEDVRMSPRDLVSHLSIFHHFHFYYFNIKILGHSNPL